MASVGLEYQKYGVSVVVTGPGTCRDGDLVIPCEAEGLPVAGVDDGAFKGVKGVKSVTLPEGLEYIGDEAFYGCGDLEKVCLPSTLRFVGEDAFAPGPEGRGIKEVHIADVVGWCQVRFLGDGSNPLRGGASLFIGKELASDLVIPEGVPCVARRAFIGCGSIKTLTLSDGVERVMEDAFRWCKGLRKVTLGKGLKKIDGNAFSGSKHILEVVNLSELYIEAGSEENGGVSLTAINVSKAEKGAGEFFTKDSFGFFRTGERCLLISYDGPGGNVVLPEMDEIGKYEVGEDAFSLNREITNLTIPLSVTHVGKKAFYGCDNLRTVAIGDGVEEIEGHAFSTCPKLYRVSLGKGLKKIEDDAFLECTNLLEVENLSPLDIEPGSEDCGCIAQYAENVYTETKGKSLVETVGNFKYFKGVKRCVLVESSLEGECLALPNPGFSYEIMPFAFSEKDVLMSLIVPACVKRIGTCAFRECHGLRSVAMEEGMEEIGGSAFAECEALAFIVIPKSLKKVERFAFSECKGLSRVYYAGSEEDFKKISVGSANEAFTEAEKYIFTEKRPGTSGRFWHYKDGGEPEEW